MEITHIGNRGIVFTFDDLSTPDYACPTNVYVINTSKSFFICDTFLGPASMKEVKDYLEEKYGEKEYIVFNSHSHWDHHWGNSAFPMSKIIAHELCMEDMRNNAESELERNAEFKRGKITITYPNLLFKNNLDFDEEQVLIFHSPGHTLDSSSCYDSADKVLFAGDNLEEPIPYINSNLEGLKQYIESLKYYATLDIEAIIPGHGLICDKSLLEANLHYLENLPNLAEPIDIEKYGKSFYIVHLGNLNRLAKIYADEKNNQDAIKYFKLLLEINEQVKIYEEDAIKTINQRIKDLEK
ncbi:MAG: MBL fold metallo-hydrolase [Candidatus Heimdallarchaeota archaeon]